MKPEEEAAKLLPCIKPCREKSDWPIEAHYIDCPAYYRPAVAAALRERPIVWRGSGSDFATDVAAFVESMPDNERQRFERQLASKYAPMRERDERIAMLRATLDISYEAEQASGAIRRALDEKLAALEAEVASLQTAERVAAEIAQDQIAAIAGHLRYIAGCHLKDDQQRERIAALEKELGAYRKNPQAR